MTMQAQIDSVPAGRVRKAIRKSRQVLARREPAQSKPAAARARRPGAVELPILLAVVTIALIYAWTRRNTGDLTAETGLGYYLGIVGGVMMLTLLAYPLRKRLRVLRFLGNIRGWFRLHMILGLIGPTAVVLHSNFTLGSLNGKAAMISMLVVAASGLIGRFLYARIHRGLYGRKETLRERMADIEAQRDAWSADLSLSVNELLLSYQTRRLDGVTSFWGSLVTTLTGPFSRAKLGRSLRRELRRARTGAGVDIDEKAFAHTLHKYFLTLGRAEAYRFYERLFAAWHVLHLPLFIILVLSAFAHVIAVHLY